MEWPFVGWLTNKHNFGLAKLTTNQFTVVFDDIGVVVSAVTWSNSSSRKQEQAAQNSHSIWLVVVVVVVVGSGVMVQLCVVEPLKIPNCPKTTLSSQHCSRDSH